MNNMNIIITLVISIVGITSNGWANNTKQWQEFRLNPIVSGTIFNDDSPLDSTQLLSVGKPYKKYSRILIKFGVDTLPIDKYANVKQAILELSVRSVDNPNNMPTVIGVMKRPWTPQAVKWSGKMWPKRSTSRGYIDFAYEVISDALKITKSDDTIKLDVTDMVSEWLYQGIQNDGFIIRTGVNYLGGNRNKGNWKIQFSKPILSVTLVGKSPTPQSIKKRTLRWYPSALLPPVSKPYYFLRCFWGGGGKLFWKDYRYGAIDIEGTFCKKDLLQRGILSLKGVDGPETKYHDTFKSFKAYYSHPVGIAIDEWQRRESSSYMYKGKKIPLIGYGAKVDYALDAIRAVEKEHPETFTCVYWRGEKSLLELAGEGLPDLVVIEGYTHTPPNPRWSHNSIEQYFPKVEHAKQNGMLNRTILMLGTLAAPGDYLKYYKDNPLTPELLEEQIKTVRENFPEMPGIGFYIWTGVLKTRKAMETNAKFKDLILAADRLAWKYYIKPAPKVIIDRPDYNAVLTYPHVVLQAKAKGQEGRNIQQYKWFIDNRLVAKTKENKWVWDIRGETKGMHIITVHVIDSEWNRGSAQMPIFVR